VTAIWIMIGALAVATALLKIAGPVTLGGKPLHADVFAIVELLASALLAALVVVETFGHGRSLVVDARLAGVAFAAFALWRRAPMTIVVVGAAVVTALVRLL
jgi:hypothetical protein